MKGCAVMKVGDKIKTLRKANKMTQDQLAKKLNVAPTSVSAWERNANKPMMDKLSQIAELFDVQITYFYENELIDRPSFRRIPIIGKIACGDPIDREENIEGYRYELAQGLPSGDLVSLVADGDSMSPTIQHGSFVTIKKQTTADDGQMAAVRFRETGEVTLKRIKRQGQMLLLIPDNSDYDTIVVTHENPADIVGRVIRVTVDF